MQSLNGTEFDTGDWELIFDRHDQLVRDCVMGNISFEHFAGEYDNFYMRYALDGHEAGTPAELAHLARLAERIAPHREIWDSILSSGFSNGYAMDPETYQRHGFFGSEEAYDRLLQLVREYPQLLDHKQ
jgi:hypothetical protein